MGRPRKNKPTSPEPDPDQSEADESWFCPLCDLEVLDDDNHPQCEKCFFWFHLKCAGFERDTDLPEGAWYCSKCVSGKKLPSSTPAEKGAKSDPKKTDGSSVKKRPGRKKKNVKTSSEVEDDSSDSDVPVKKTVPKTEKKSISDGSDSEASPKKTKKKPVSEEKKRKPGRPPKKPKEEPKNDDDVELKVQEPKTPKKRTSRKEVSVVEPVTEEEPISIDLQTWWEVPSIAHFCSLFRLSFNLLDFDIEDLEEALLTDGSDDDIQGPLILRDLIVRLLKGILSDIAEEINGYNYETYLRRIIKVKWEEQDGHRNPFKTSDAVEFPSFPLRTKVELLHALTDYRLQSEDVPNELKNLEADSLRVEPLGHDEEGSTYWYFYGTRLYKEDLPYEARMELVRKKEGDKPSKDAASDDDDADGKPKKRGRKSKKELEEQRAKEEEKRRPLWQVVCYSRDDWESLARRFSEAKSKDERALYATLVEDFLPEIPRLFEEKERIQRKRMSECAPRRSSSRLERQKTKKEEEDQLKLAKEAEEAARLQRLDKDGEEREIAKYREVERLRREERFRLRELQCAASCGDPSLEESDGLNDVYDYTPPPRSSSAHEDYPSPVLAQTPTREEEPVVPMQPPQFSRLFDQPSQSDKDDDKLKTKLRKVLKFLTKKGDRAWPFSDTVDEKAALRYYSVISNPMNLSVISEKVERGKYATLAQFEKDVQLIVSNCCVNDEYMDMGKDLEKLYKKAATKILENTNEYSSDEESLDSLIIEEEKDDDVSFEEEKSPKITKEEKKPAKKVAKRGRPPKGDLSSPKKRGRPPKNAKPSVAKEVKKIKAVDVKKTARKEDSDGELDSKKKTADEESDAEVVEKKKPAKKESVEEFQSKKKAAKKGNPGENSSVKKKLVESDDSDDELEDLSKISKTDDSDEEFEKVRVKKEESDEEFVMIEKPKVQKGKEETSPVKKRRGRPPKNPPSSGSPVKKRVGRPRKSSQSADKGAKKPSGEPGRRQSFLTPETVDDTSSSDDEEEVKPDRSKSPAVIKSVLKSKPAVSKPEKAKKRPRSDSFSVDPGSNDEDEKKTKKPKVVPKKRKRAASSSSDDDLPPSSGERKDELDFGSDSSSAVDRKKSKKKKKVDGERHHRRKHEKDNHKKKKKTRKESRSPSPTVEKVDSEARKSGSKDLRRSQHHNSNSSASSVHKRKSDGKSGSERGKSGDRKDRSKRNSDDRINRRPVTEEIVYPSKKPPPNAFEERMTKPPVFHGRRQAGPPPGFRDPRYSALSPPFVGKSPRSEDDALRGFSPAASSRPPMIPAGKKRHRSKGSESDYEAELKWELEERKRRKEREKRLSGKNDHHVHKPSFHHRGKSPARHSSGSDFGCERPRKEAILLPGPPMPPNPPPKANHQKKDIRSRLAKDGMLGRKNSVGSSSGSSQKETKFVDPALDSLISRVKEFRQYKAAMDRGPNFASNGGNGLLCDENESGPRLNMGTVLHTDFARKHILSEAGRSSPPLLSIKETSPPPPGATDADLFESVLGKPVAVVESVKKVDEGKNEEPGSQKTEEPEVEDKMPVSKAMPNLSAWFKAFGQPKKKLPPVATVKPSTPVKDAAPWAYEKYEKEKNAASNAAQKLASAPSAAAVPPPAGNPVPQPPPELTKPSPPLAPPSVSQPMPSPTPVVPPGGPMSQPPLQSPQHGSDKSPMYASSESEVQSPQTPNYPGGWASEPSPSSSSMRDPQRSPHIGLGHSAYPGGVPLPQKSPVPQEPLRVGFYQDMTQQQQQLLQQQNKPSPEGSTASSAAPSPMTPCTPLTPQSQQQQDSGVMSPESLYNSSKNGGQPYQHINKMVHSPLSQPPLSVGSDTSIRSPASNQSTSAMSPDVSLKIVTQQQQPPPPPPQQRHPTQPAPQQRQQQQLPVAQQPQNLQQPQAQVPQAAVPQQPPQAVPGNFVPSPYQNQASPLSGGQQMSPASLPAQQHQPPPQPLQHPQQQQVVAQRQQPSPHMPQHNLQQQQVQQQRQQAQQLQQQQARQPAQQPAHQQQPVQHRTLSPVQPPVKLQTNDQIPAAPPYSLSGLTQMLNRVSPDMQSFAGGMNPAMRQDPLNLGMKLGNDSGSPGLTDPWARMLESMTKSGGLFPPTSSSSPGGGMAPGLAGYGAGYPSAASMSTLHHQQQPNQGRSGSSSSNYPQVPQQQQAQPASNQRKSTASPAASSASYGNSSSNPSNARQQTLNPAAAAAAAFRMTQPHHMGPYANLSSANPGMSEQFGAPGNFAADRRSTSSAASSGSSSGMNSSAQGAHNQHPGHQAAAHAHAAHNMGKSGHQMDYAGYGLSLQSAASSFVDPVPSNNPSTGGQASSTASTTASCSTPATSSSTASPFGFGGPHQAAASPFHAFMNHPASSAALSRQAAAAFLPHHLMDPSAAPLYQQLLQQRQQEEFLLRAGGHSAAAAAAAAGSPSSMMLPQGFMSGAFQGASGYPPSIGQLPQFRAGRWP